MYKNHYLEIDYIKGTAIILMILGHSIAARNLGMTELKGFQDVLYKFIYSFHMSLFFLASGFLYKYEDSYWKYIWKKVKRIFVPYIIFNSLLIFARMLFPNLTVDRDVSYLEILKGTLLYGGNLWFLYVLFIIFLIFPLIDNTMHNNTPPPPDRLREY